MGVATLNLTISSPAKEAEQLSLTWEQIECEVEQNCASLLILSRSKDATRPGLRFPFPFKVYPRRGRVPIV